MRKAKVLRKTFKPREGFDPAELRETTKARIWYAPEVARWEVEKGALPLVDGAAVGERSVGSADWLVGEVLSFRGAAVVLEPLDLRKQVATRAAELEKELRAAAPPARAAARR
jgi:predicted DNA-binding transcriptional regulator YafY